MYSLREFFTSSSGLVPARQGLGLGWVISALTGVAILLGAKQVKADDHECDHRIFSDDCPYNSGCARKNRDAPNRCCYYEQFEDCSLFFLRCECVP